MASPRAQGVEVFGPARDEFGDVLSADALEFVAGLQRELDGTRRELLARRAERQAAFDAGELPGFPEATAGVRESGWRAPPPPADLIDRRVEITGPTDRKMMINALNSGARVFMADFEDANAPTWRNMFGGQRHLSEAVAGTIAFDAPDGRRYRLGEQVAVLMPRPRGWHLDERHLLVDGRPAAASLVDFGLAVFRNATALLERGSGPYFYLPKLESHHEARLWADAFAWAEDRLGLDRGSVRATVLIETITAAFEMDEILHALGPHALGLNAGRWDYMFSVIKRFHSRPEFVLPDRNSVTMTVPFMRAYTELLVATCHRRGAFAMGGMAAFIPSRRDPQVNEVALAKVRDDKERESRDGFDGTWVAHPDLVPVATECFDQVLGIRPNQVERQRDDVRVTAADLLAVAATPGQASEAGLRNDVGVGLQYLAAWLGGLGAVGIFNLMEDAATAEIARSQVWQWVRHGVRLAGGQAVTPELVRRVADQECAKLTEAAGGSYPNLDAARELFELVSLSDDFIEFLTIPAYDRLE